MGLTLTTLAPVEIKILGIRQSERYAVRRLILAAQHELALEYPGVELRITDITDPGQINAYAYFLIQPSLVINESMVCSGHVPSKGEVAGWLRQAFQAASQPAS
jgi:hypothetical protein